MTTNQDSTSIVPPGSLRDAMLNAFFSSDASFNITFQDNLGTITLVDHLPVLSSYQSATVTFTVDGGVGNTIDGGEFGTNYISNDVAFTFTKFF